MLRTPFQGLTTSGDTLQPRPLAWAVLGRPFGAEGTDPGVQSRKAGWDTLSPAGEGARGLPVGRQVPGQARRAAGASQRVRAHFHAC